MRKFLISLCLMGLSQFVVCAQDQKSYADSSIMARIEAKLTDYFHVLENIDIESQARECDIIISSANDPALRQVIARKVYDHYMNSGYMGFEAVAIHVFDRWFADKTLKMADEQAYLDAKIFAEFNRASLIGKKAPVLNVQIMQGDSLEVFSSPGGNYKALCFYDVDCPKCLYQTLMLKDLLSVSSVPLDFYAFYVGDDRDEWGKYVERHLQFGNPKINMTHVWDPQLTSDFQRKYGVIKTPRLFFISPDGKILGRGLDAMTLAQMLVNTYQFRTLDYGQKQSDAVFGRMFKQMGAVDKDGVKEVADHIASSTLAQSDTAMFRQMMGDLMYYLADQFEEPYKEGLYHMTDKYILSKPEIWKTADDSLKVVGMAQTMHDLLSRAAPGTIMPSIKVPGVLLTCGKEKAVSRSLKRIGKKRNIIIFYLPTCSQCVEEKQAAMKLLEEDRKGIAVYMVNVDEINSRHPELGQKLMDSFDMSMLPNIYITDKSGRILRRFVSLL